MRDTPHSGGGNPPRFLSFEGVEGCGKSTQIKILAEKLSKHGIETISTREPGGTPFGESLRSLLLDRHASLAPKAELLLYLADRAHHLTHVVQPALEAGKWVLTDRFADATEAYQAGGRSLDMKFVRHLNTEICASTWPHRTFWLDLPLQEGLRRARRREGDSASDQDRFERESMEFHKRVRAGYGAIHKREPNRVFKVDARGSIEAVAQRIWALVVPWIPKSHG